MKTISNRFLILLSVVLMLPSVLWMQVDDGVWEWDDCAYGRHSVAMWSSIVGANEESWSWLMLNFRREKAPGVSWVTQGFVGVGDLLGNIQDALLSSSLLLNGLSLYLIGRCLCVLFSGRPYPVIMGVVFVAATPNFIDLSHRYMTEPLQLACISAFYLLASRAGALEPLKLFLWMLFLSSLSLMAKVTTPIYVLLPGLWCLGILLDMSRRRVAWLRAWSLWTVLLIVMAFLSFVATLAWYLVNAEVVFGYVDSVSSGGASFLYGEERSFGGKLAWWLTALHDSSFLPWFILLLPLVACLGALRLGGAIAKTAPGQQQLVCRLFVGIAILEIAGCIYLFSTHIEEIHRLLYGLLPALAILAAQMVQLVPSRKAAVGMIVVMLLQLGFVQAQALGWDPGRHLASGMVLRQADIEGSRRADVEALMDRTWVTEAKQDRGRMLIVSLPWLNSNTLNFYAGIRYLEERVPYTMYSSTGFAARNVEAVQKKIEELRPLYLISVTPEEQRKDAASLVTVGLDLLTSLENRKDYQRQTFDSRHGILLFQHQPTENLGNEQ